jgi:hypothetical protein
MAVDKNLERQIKADPRVQELANSRKRGSIPGVVDAAALREMGYNIPDGFKYTSGGGRIPAQVYQENDKWDKIITAAGATILGAGVAGIAGVGPLAGGGGSLPTSLPGEMTGVNGANIAGGGGGGIWGALKKFLPDILGGAGRAASGAAQASANNRGAQLDAEMEAKKLNQQAYRDWYNQMVERETTGVGVRNDAWKAVQQGDYVENWKAPTQKFSPYTRDLEAPSDAMRQAGGARRDDARSRLTGYSLPEPERQTYNLDPKLLEGSIWEKLLGYGGAAGEAIGGFWNPQAPKYNPKTGRYEIPQSGGSYITPDDVATTMPVGRPQPVITDFRDPRFFRDPLIK